MSDAVICSWCDRCYASACSKCCACGNETYQIVGNKTYKDELKLELDHILEQIKGERTRGFKFVKEMKSNQFDKVVNIAKELLKDG